MYIRTVLSISLTITGSALAAPLVTAKAVSWPDPEPCKGNCTGIHDPAVIKRSDGKWFRLSTNGNIAIASANSITGPWTYNGAMLPKGSLIQLPLANQEIWAPDVSKIGNLFYAYYSVSAIGSQKSDIGVATSPTLEVRSWTDHGSIGIPQSTKYNVIDPNWFQEAGNSTMYLNFGSAWDGVFQTKLDSSALTVAAGAGTPRDLIYNSTVPSNQKYPSVTEGSFLFWWKVNGHSYYYMFFSSGACCNAADSLASEGDEYKIMVCRSDSREGPFVDANGHFCATDNGGTLVLGSHGSVYAPGGQGVYYDSSLGRPVVYYHYVDPTIGYEYEKFQFGFNYLDFSSGWPVVVS